MLKQLLRSKEPLLYFILDPETIQGETLLSAARTAIKAGIKLIQYRDKYSPAGQFLKNAQILRALAKKHRIIFIINDRLDIALACGADGVHLGQDDLPVTEARKLLGPDKIIGLSTTSIDQVKKARLTSADYLGFGPLFRTPAKPGALGLAKLKAAIKCSRKPLVTLGGIDRHNILKVAGTKVPMIAVRGVFRQGKTLYSDLVKLKETIRDR